MVAPKRGFSGSGPRADGVQHAASVVEVSTGENHNGFWGTGYDCSHGARSSSILGVVVVMVTIMVSIRIGDTTSASAMSMRMRTPRIQTGRMADSDISSLALPALGRVIAILIASRDAVGIGIGASRFPCGPMRVTNTRAPDATAAELAGVATGPPAVLA